jgi:hypothetical protein
MCFRAPNLMTDPRGAENPAKPKKPRASAKS